MAHGYWRTDSPLKKRVQLVCRKLGVTQDLAQEPPPEHPPGVNWNGQGTSIRVSHSDVASSLSRHLKAGLPQGPKHLVCPMRTEPVHLTVTL